MQFQTPLLPATLLRRYKRFLADIRLDDGREAVAHCPNPGAMLGLMEPGSRIWVEQNDDPRKKLKFGWRLSELETGHLAGIDTGIPNKIVKEALQTRKIVGLGDYEAVRPEQKYGRNSRVDFLLEGDRTTYLEVKNVRLRRSEDWAEFPDCVTARGTKHLQDLTDIVAQGDRAVMLYVVQRSDCNRFRLAADIDPSYAQAFDIARNEGVEMLCYGTHISTQQIQIAGPIPVDLSLQSLF